jgi:hypothetical protein
MEGGRTQAAHNEDAEEHGHSWHDADQAQQRCIDDNAKGSDQAATEPVRQRAKQRLCHGRTKRQRGDEHRQNRFGQAKPSLNRR